MVEERPAKRARNGSPADDSADFNVSMEDIFGEEDVNVTQSGLDKVLADVAEQSEAESHISRFSEEFQVDDPDKPGLDEAAQYGLNPSKLTWVCDIFGDADVLKPLGDIDAGEEQAIDASVHANLGAAEAAVAASLAKPEHFESPKEESKVGDVLPLVDALDPDVLEKAYQLPSDHAVARSQQPERWLQAYAKGQEPLPNKTEEEFQNEAEWIYQQVFKKRAYEEEMTQKSINRVLIDLHVNKLELLYIVEHVHWNVAKVLTKEDIWKIQEYDMLWQPIWKRYLLLKDWVWNLEQNVVMVPEHIKQKVSREVWKDEYAEKCQRDAHDWLKAMHPTSAPSAESQSITSSVDAVMKMCRRCKFDEKLGIVESLDTLSLVPFGIRPSELGDNIAHDKQLIAPREDTEEEHVDDVCTRHVTPEFPTKEAVRDAVTTFLMRLIASEPRVRDFVRKEFRKYCAISARVTEAGRALAKEAAHSFKKSYRGFHVRYRPAWRFDESSDLFLEMMQLQEKGLIKIEYDLVMVEEDNDGKSKQKIVQKCQSYENLIKITQQLTSHAQKRHDPEQYMPTDPEELEKWNKSEEIILKLEAAYQLSEAAMRRSAAWDFKEKVKACYQSASLYVDIDSLRSFIVEDPIFEKLSSMYCVTVENTATTSQVVDTNWNKVRRTILRRVLAEELYPMLWGEVQDYLIQQSSQVVCQETREKLSQMLDVQPQAESEGTLNEAEDKLKQMRQDDESDLSRRREDPNWISERAARMKGLCSTLVILPEATKRTSAVGFVNAFGEAVDMRSLFTDCLRQERPKKSLPEKGSYQYDVELKVREHRDQLKHLLATYKPAVILLAVTDQDILSLKANLDTFINRDQDLLVHFKVVPKIFLVDTTVPRAVAYNKRVMESPAYRDYDDPSIRIAISCARYYQDPLAEACQLWHEIPDENGLLKLALHPLQRHVPKEMMSRTITRTLQEVLANSGLQINKVRRSMHMASLIQFLPGLGPRKAKLFMKALSNSVKSRQAVVDVLSKQLNIPEKDRYKNPVIVNMLPFIKIEPDFRDAWNEEESPSLDRLRIPPSLHNWVLAFCREALEGQSNELFGEPVEEDLPSDDIVARVIRLLREDSTFVNIIQDRDWAMWPTNAGEPNFSDCADIDTLFDRIVKEVSAPYKDLRQNFSEIAESELFYLAMAESQQEFKTGCVVRGIVLEDDEFPTKDSSKEKPSVPKVSLRIGAGISVRGSFPKAYPQSKASAWSSGHIPGCDRQFVWGEAVLARVRDINVGKVGFSIRLSVDLDEETWFTNFPVLEKDLPFFLPNPTEDWTKVSLGVVDNSDLKRKAELKEWVRRPRNIKHPHFIVGDHPHVVQVLQRQMIGFSLFRSSKHYDCLFGLLKVKPTMAYEESLGGGNEQVPAEQCYRLFDVFEHRPQKTYGYGFEVAHELEVEGKVYRDFDEIIARHMDPIIANLKKITQHQHFGLQVRRDVKILDPEQVKEMLQHFSQDDPMLNYKLLLHDKQIGHGMLLWGIGGRKVREELLEVYPDGFRLFGNHFPALKQAISWFKTTGWRNAAKLRRDVKQEWQVKTEEIKQKRGEHADPDAWKRRKNSLRTAIQQDGLRTPAGFSNMATPTNFTREANARTPYGFNPGTTRTVPPTPAMAGTPRVAPETPAAAFASHGAMPRTPADAFLGHGRPPSTPQFAGAMPGTPADAFLRHGRQPSTPQFAGGVTPGGIIPQTPIQVGTGSLLKQPSIKLVSVAMFFS